MFTTIGCYSRLDLEVPIDRSRFWESHDHIKFRHSTEILDVFKIPKIGCEGHAPCLSSTSGRLPGIITEKCFISEPLKIFEFG